MIWHMMWAIESREAVAVDVRYPKKLLDKLFLKGLS